MLGGEPEAGHKKRRPKWSPELSGVINWQNQPNSPSLLHPEFLIKPVEDRFCKFNKVTVSAIKLTAKKTLRRM